MISKLLCKFEYENDYNEYVATLIKRSGMSAKVGGGEEFLEYVGDVLKDEDWP